jgi:hypothetical protein
MFSSVNQTAATAGASPWQVAQRDVLDEKSGFSCTVRDGHA